MVDQKVSGAPSGFLPPSREELENVLKRQKELLHLLHQVNFQVLVLAEALVQRNVITQQDIQQAKKKLVKGEEEVKVKVDELRSTKCSQKEKVFQAIPFRIRPEELRIPTSEFFRHLREYLRLNEGTLSTPAMIDLAAYYGLPRKSDGHWA
jgi:hypothetical protein